MATFKNVSPFGAIDVDVIGRRGIEPGEEFEVPDEIAPAFIGQDEIFEPVDVSGVVLPDAEETEQSAEDASQSDDGDASGAAEEAPGEQPAEQNKKGGRRGNAA